MRQLMQQHIAQLLLLQLHLRQQNTRPPQAHQHRRIEQAAAHQPHLLLHPQLLLAAGEQQLCPRLLHRGAPAQQLFAGGKIDSSLPNQHRCRPRKPDCRQPLDRPALRGLHRQALCLGKLFRLRPGCAIHLLLLPGNQSLPIDGDDCLFCPWQRKGNQQAQRQRHPDKAVELRPVTPVQKRLQQHHHQQHDRDAQRPLQHPRKDLLHLNPPPFPATT